MSCSGAIFLKSPPSIFVLVNQMDGRIDSFRLLQVFWNICLQNHKALNVTKDLQFKDLSSLSALVVWNPVLTKKCYNSHRQGSCKWLWTRVKNRNRFSQSFQTHIVPRAAIKLRHILLGFKFISARRSLALAQWLTLPGCWRADLWNRGISLTVRSADFAWWAGKVGGIGQSRNLELWIGKFRMLLP